MSRVRRLLINASVVLCTLLLCVVFFELGARLYYGHPIALWLTEGERDVQTDFDVTYSVTPDGGRVVCQSAAPPGAPRDVFFVGDSFTFGMGIEDLKDFVGQLSCRFPQLRFHNFGSVGQGLNYYRMAVEQKMPEQTQALFIVLFENDLIHDKNLEVRDLKDWLFRHTFIFPLLHNAKVDLQGLLRPYQVGPDEVYNSPRAVFSADPASLQPVISLSDHARSAFAERLERLLAVALEARPGLEIHMTLIPEAATVSPAHQDFYRSVGATRFPVLGQPSPAYGVAAEVCTRHPACAFVDIFAEVRAAGPELYFAHDFHLNEAGHRYLADRLAPILARLESGP